MAAGAPAAHSIEDKTMSNPAVAETIQSTLAAARRARLKRLLPGIIMPMVGILAFLLFWQLVASNIHTSLGQFPGPSQVATQFSGLLDAQVAEHKKAAAFKERQAARNAELLAKDPNATQTERMEALQNLLASRQPSGLRGESTQSNVQALRAIAQISKNWTTKDRVQCNITLDGQESKVTIGT